jgi:protoporphyrinogen oxidase
MAKSMSGAESGQAVVIIGAGPAGLTAAYELARHGFSSVVLESDEQVGGISRTVERDGWRFDLGGHRFFTKVRRVEDFWHEVLPPDEFLLRPRVSRIFYQGKFYDYPLRGLNALRNLGVWEAFLCVASYVKARIRPPKDQSTFEGWVASRFGWRLYRTFFKTYTEKVWGVPADQIQADWAAQRIKNLSLGKAVVNALLPKGRNSTKVTSLIEQFQYPKFGPGMMWEKCAELVEHSFPDNWIYIHSPEAKVGRIQNFCSWSPYLVKDGRTCLGLEYFVNEGDDLWDSLDTDLVDIASREIDGLGLVPAARVERGYVVRVPKAYPVYDGNYSTAVETIRTFLAEHWPEIHPVGRNGMHRYNNQDHSMLTAMITVDNIVHGAADDVWAVNVDEDYHEETTDTSIPSGTGRSAPLIPTQVSVNLE